MKRLIKLTIFTALLSYAPGAIAQEWTEVTVNAVGDRFLVDQASIQPQANSVRYWEYRDFRQPNNAFVEEEIDEPVYGVMLYQSVDCTANVARLRQMVVHGRDRQELRRLNYGNNGSLAQPADGSSASAVLRYVCTQEENSTTNEPQG
ncbi:hypothetical protein IQ268_22000 [Oculatella sp. LEGE 06141]|nr:hypothetical protein [Oculatella sp. LEGE 06141]